MKIINTNALDELVWGSPGGKFAASGKQVSEALGRDRDSLHALERHPFDVEICRIPPGKIPFPYHAHSAQWEFYHVLSGSGSVRHADGITNIVAGDAFIFKPGEAHQLIGGNDEELVLYIIADNPVGESCYYPDSNKWSVPLPDRRLVRSDALDYFDGEE